MAGHLGAQGRDVSRVGNTVEERGLGGVEEELLGVVVRGVAGHW